MQIFYSFIVVAAAYFLGSLSGAIALSKGLLGEDVRKEGSGNAGATNMARVFGLGFGVITLLCDCLKSVAAILLGYWLLGEWGIFLGGISCIVGHCYPAIYRFKGGKGVSVGAVIAFAVDWRVFLAVVVTFALTAGISKKVSLGSVCAALMISVAALVVGVSLPRLLLAVLAMLLVVFRHRDNIIRILNGDEADFKAAKPRCLRLKKKTE